MPSTYALEDIQALESEIADLRDRLGEACQEGHRHELRAAELTEQVTHWQDNSKFLGGRLEEEIEEKKALEQRLDNQYVSIGVLQEKLDKSRAAHDALKVKLANAEDANAAKMRSIESYSMRVLQAEQKRDSAEADAMTLRKRVAELTDQLSATRQSLEDIQRERDELRVELSRVQSKWVEAADAALLNGGNLVELEGECEQLRKRVRKLEEALSHGANISPFPTLPDATSEEKLRGMTERVRDTFLGQPPESLHETIAWWMLRSDNFMREALSAKRRIEELKQSPSSSPAIPDDSMLMKKDEVTWLYEQHGKLNDALVALEEYVAYKVSLDMHTNGGSE